MYAKYLVAYGLCSVVTVAAAACSGDESSGGGGGGAGGQMADAGGSAGMASGGGGTSSTGGSSGSGGTVAVGGGGSGGSGGSAEAGATVSFSGTTVAPTNDAAGGAARAGVEVCVIDLQGNVDTSFECATTDASGDFTITGLSPNTEYLLRFQGTDLLTVLVPVDMVDADVTRGAPVLIPDAGATPISADAGVSQDAGKGSMLVFAIGPSGSDGGTTGISGFDWTADVTYTIAPTTAEGPLYIVSGGGLVDTGATATTDAGVAWFVNMVPGTYTVTASHPTRACRPIAGSGFGWPEGDTSLRAPALAGAWTNPVGFFCPLPVSDAGTD